MATFYLLNDVRVGTQPYKAGALIDDAQNPTAPILAVGGVLWPSSDAKVAAAAVIVTKLRAQGQSGPDLAAMMNDAASATLQVIDQSATGPVTAGTTRTQAGATVLSGTYNRVDTSTAPTAGTILGDGVILPTSAPGHCFIHNNTANVVQLYAQTGDTINGVVAATGVALPPFSSSVLACTVAGAWAFDAGLGYAGAIPTELSADGIAAAGTTQATATPLGAANNNVTTVAVGTGVNLPAAAAGLTVLVENNGANPLLVYPAQGATDTINGVAATTGVALHPGTAALFTCTKPGAWTTAPTSPVMAVVNTNTTTVSATLTAANVTGAVAAVDLALTGTLGGAANAQLPTVTAVVAALHAPTVGTSYRLRITNRSAGAFAWTVTTNTGWTLTGTMTIAQNTWREFVVTLTSLSAATITSVAVGTYS